MSHNLMGPHGLLQGSSTFYISFFTAYTYEDPSKKGIMNDMLTSMSFRHIF
jgi:hypothetical protein